jgi:hypothetical protein
MERQLQNAPIQTDDLVYPSFTHTAEGEESITEAAAQTIFDSPPRRPYSERLSPAEEVGGQYASGPSAGRKRKREDVIDNLSSKSVSLSLKHYNVSLLTTLPKSTKKCVSLCFAESTTSNRRIADFDNAWMSKWPVRVWNVHSAWRRRRNGCLSSVGTSSVMVVY